MYQANVRRPIDAHQLSLFFVSSEHIVLLLGARKINRAANMADAVALDVSTKTHPSAPKPRIYLVLR